ncbi:MAG TPA: hypothetical protein VNE39_17935 [Planctomycetota bacterium]|nr:hypothetical protein [Planctomycetota bacterium]
MTRQTTKEQVLFLVGAAIFIWVIVKLGLFLTHQPRPTGSPMVPAADVRPGDSAIGDFLATRGLDTYLDRGTSDPFGGPASQPTEVFVRSLVSHAFLRSSRISRYTYECRMSPHPVREMRFRLPTAATKVADVFSRELDDERKWGVDGTTLVVPVKPLAIKRAYYRCQVTVVVQAPFTAPVLWTAPVVSCTDATPNVQCEVGAIAVATPGDLFELTLKEAPQGGLTRLAVESVPKELAATSNKFAYTFRQPAYTLTLDVKPKFGAVAVVPPTKGGPPPLKATNPPPLKATNPPAVKDTQPKEEPKKLDIPKAADADSLPFKLTAIVEIREPEPRRQAVLRNKDSGEYMRKFEGDTVMDDLRVVSITDDAVVVVDSKGKHYKFRGRFEDKYNE